MLAYNEWLDSAMLVPMGQKRRRDHTCGPGSTLLLSHDDKGHSAYCFRCNEGGFKEHGMRTLDQLKAAQEARDYAISNAGEGRLELPGDFTQDIGIHGRLWYYRAGITDGIARLYGFGWSDSQSRVILPVRSRGDGNLLAVQGRAVREGQQPKYLNIKASNRGGVGFFSDPRTIGYYSRGLRAEDQDAPGTRIVIAEDILSAIRIGMSIQACCLLGTKLDDQLAAQLTEWDTVTFFLDGDKAGVKGRLQGMRTLKLMHPGQINYIETRADPKNLSQEEIELCLHKSRSGNYSTMMF